MEDRICQDAVALSFPAVLFSDYVYVLSHFTCCLLHVSYIYMSTFSFLPVTARAKYYPVMISFCKETSATLHKKFISLLLIKKAILGVIVLS